MNKKHTHELINSILQDNHIKVEDMAKEITCSISTLKRLISQETYPTQKFITELERLKVNGFDNYKKVSLHKKSKISEKKGTIGGFSIGAITSGLGIASISGLSGAGITAGLAAIGGTMVAGVATLVAAPVAVGAVGYGIVKGINSYNTKNKLNKEEIDEIWECK